MRASESPLWRRYLRFLRPDLKADVDDELSFHLHMRARDFERLGYAPDAAREEAAHTFGDIDQIRNEVVSIDDRRSRRWSRKEKLMNVLHDVQLSARSLRRSPGFSVMAMLCVAIGIATTATVFGAVRGVLLRPLPYRDDDRLAAVYGDIVARGEKHTNISYADFLAWQGLNRTFSDIGIWTWNTFTVSSDADAERIDAALVSANLFGILGVAPMLGRQFTPDEEEPGRRVILLGHGLWQRRFAGDRNIVGRTIRVNAQDYTVVGVMPPGFSFPERGQAWRPMAKDLTTDPGNRFLAGAIGRLKDGVAIETARSDLNRVMRLQQARNPRAYDGWDADVRTLRDDLVGNLRRPVLVFFGAVGLLLLVVCVNVASLMLARGVARARELGIRVALGAERRRIIGHVLLESLLVAAIGGAMGILITPWGLHLFSKTFEKTAPFYLSFRVDGVVIGFVAALVMLSTLFMGMVPALRAGRLDAASAVREGGRGGVGGLHSTRLRSALVVAELALSVVLLVGAFLLIRSYQTLTSTQLGFDVDPLLAARVSLPVAEYRDREARRAYWTQVYERLSAIPGVTRVGSADGIPFSGWQVEAGMTIEGKPGASPNDVVMVHYQNVSPGYFAAIGARILRGRDLVESDRDTNEYVGVINETLANKEFKNVDPIGRRMKWGDATSTDPWIRIVGVVSEFRHYRLPEPMRPAIYLSQMASTSLSQTLVLRTTLADPRSIEPQVRSILREVEQDAPAYEVRTFADVVSGSLWRQRLQGQVLGLFAIVALLLSALGTYGVISYAVAQRTRELGVRMALGASRSRVRMLVLGEGALLAACGITIGLGAAWVLRGAVAQLLYGVAPTDWVTFVSVPVALTLVTVAASLIPAQRATRVDPAVAMRAE